LAFRRERVDEGRAEAVGRRVSLDHDAFRLLETLRQGGSCEEGRIAR
jgi:hypothetical protein